MSEYTVSNQMQSQIRKSFAFTAPLSLLLYSTSHTTVILTMHTTCTSITPPSTSFTLSLHSRIAVAEQVLVFMFSRDGTEQRNDNDNRIKEE